MPGVRVIRGGIHVLDHVDVDTDQIVPKQFLKRIERTGFGQFLFHDWRQEGLELDPESTILVTGRNFGSGSSREHAVWALHDFGFRVIVAPSFADTFYSNCVKNGLLPVVLADDTVRALMQAREAVVDLPQQTVIFDEPEQQVQVIVKFAINAEVKENLLQGHDDIILILKDEALITRFEQRQQLLNPPTSSLPR